MQKREPTKIGSSLRIVSSSDLAKSVAQDLSIPDPTGIIAKGQQKANENSKKYDGRASGFDDLQDLFAPCE
jgi:hypothetical protein